MRKAKLLVGAVALVLVLGCNSTARREAFIEQHPELCEEVKNLIRKGGIRIGFTKEMVIAARGYPDKVAEDVSSFWIPLLVYDEWVYFGPMARDRWGHLVCTSFRRNLHLYFSNDVLYLWREIDSFLEQRCSNYIVGKTRVYDHAPDRVFSAMLDVLHDAVTLIAMADRERGRITSVRIPVSIAL